MVPISVDRKDTHILPRGRIFIKKEQVCLGR